MATVNECLERAKKLAAVSQPLNGHMAMLWQDDYEALESDLRALAKVNGRVEAALSEQDTNPADDEHHFDPVLNRQISRVRTLVSRLSAL